MGINDYLKIGGRIKTFRKSKGISQKDMAAKIGLAVSTYSNYENDLREPSVETIGKITNVLGIDLVDLLPSINTIDFNTFDDKVLSLFNMMGYVLTYDDETGKFTNVVCEEGIYLIDDIDIRKLWENVESYFLFNLNEIIKNSPKSDWEMPSIELK